MNAWARQVEWKVGRIDCSLERSAGEGKQYDACPSMIATGRYVVRAANIDGWMQSSVMHDNHCPSSTIFPDYLKASSGLVAVVF
jgi:hypothetical protein